jgi:UPF0176 protein
MKKEEVYIYTFYRFKFLKKINLLKKKLDRYSSNKIIYGTILLANEGINGTLSGKKDDLESFVLEIKKLLKIRKLSIKISKNKFVPFYRLKIRLKKEIVTIGDKYIKPEKLTGKHIPPSKWNKILTDKKFMVIDTRNRYEINIGTFKNSINPKTQSFRDFPKYFKKQKIDKNQSIAMFCTGGIRCEKASSYLLKNGFKNVVQLDGGILNYLEYKKNKKNSLWKGECFVFDNRVSIDQNLEKGTYDQCFGCRHPISDDDKKLKSYKKGVSCKYCINKRSKDQFNASVTRQQQIDRAEKENIIHNFKKIYIKQ